MPVFQETADDARDLRILPSRERPLPRLSQVPERSNADSDEYEVVIIGAGPAGMMLTLLLARYGLSDSIINFDAKPGTLKAGQADGLQPRTLEVLKSLDIADEILNHGCHMSEVAFWNPKQASTTSEKEEPEGIVRTSFVPDVVAAARYKHEVTIHQGRIERILEENLSHYSRRPIQRSTRFRDFWLDDDVNATYPLHIKVEATREDGSKEERIVRAKHLVGADGAHSQVRRSMGLELQGETTDHIWGVIDFVADTDFPDVRKRSAIHSKSGSVMIIPRERISSGQYLTRLYVQIKDEVPVEESDPDHEISKIKSANRRAKVTLDYIMDQARRVFSPYTIKKKEGTVVDWWAAYQIGQRMTPNFTLKDKTGLERVFIVGDACHTHSPKAGQGMNVSMMDSYNLGWKLAHHLHGLSPTIDGANSVLRSFEEERLTIARQLIDFDTKFSSMFSGQIGSDDAASAGLTHEEFLDVFSSGSGFTSGCGIEYPEGCLTKLSGSSPIKGNDYLQGVLKPGRRLLDVVVRRYADANIRHLQDDFLSTGRFRILVFVSTDLTSSSGSSAAALEHLCRHTIPSFPPDTLELVVLHPFPSRSFEWTDIPRGVKDLAEMNFHGPADLDVYKIYGVAQDEGAIAVVRPDGYVGSIFGLGEYEHVRDFLSGSLVTVDR